MGDSIDEKPSIWRSIQLPERIDGCAAHSLGCADCGCPACSKVIAFAKAFRRGFDARLPLSPAAQAVVDSIDRTIADLLSTTDCGNAGLAETPEPLPEALREEVAAGRVRWIAPGTWELVKPHEEKLGPTPASYWR